MKILITGVTGLLGQEILKKLIKKGHKDFVFITQNKKNLQEKLNFECKIIEWEKNYQLPQDTLDGVEAIIHLAGSNIASGRWTEKKKESLYNSRILSARSLFQLAKENLKQQKSSLHTIVSASAIGIYGNRDEEILTEESALGSGFLSALCRDWEKEIALFHQELPVRGISLRLGVILTPRGGALEKMLPPFLMGGGGKVGSGKQFMSFIHLHDAANMFIHAVEEKEKVISGSYNATASESLSNTDFTKLLGQAIRRPTIFPLPAIVLKVIFGEMSTILLDSQRCSSKKIEAAGFNFHYPTLREALENLLSHGSCYDLELTQYQEVHAPLEKVFSFFSRPENLEKLTPDLLEFKITSVSDKEMKKDLIINYRLKIHGIPIAWRTRITHYEKNSYFSDNQEKGPYKKWLHFHYFFENKEKGKTLMLDDISYRIPFGILGRFIIRFFINKDLKQIFSYRKKVVHEMFSK